MDYYVLGSMLDTGKNSKPGDTTFSLGAYKLVEYLLKAFLHILKKNK